MIFFYAKTLLMIPKMLDHKSRLNHHFNILFLKLFKTSVPRAETQGF